MEAAQRGNLVPVYRRIFADHLTPVLAYRCLVKEDDREAPSFLFESVENGKSVNMVRTDSAPLPSFQKYVHKETQASNLIGSNFWREISSFCCGFSAETHIYEVMHADAEFWIFDRVDTAWWELSHLWRSLGRRTASRF